MDDDDEYYEYYYRRQHEWTLASFLAFFLVVFIRYAIPNGAKMFAFGTRRRFARDHRLAGLMHLLVLASGGALLLRRIQSSLPSPRPVRDRLDAIVVHRERPAVGAAVVLRHRPPLLAQLRRRLVLVVVR